MSKIEIDVTANTTKAEKALIDLSHDVDKLQRKAQSVGQGQRYSSRKDTAGAGSSPAHTQKATGTIQGLDSLKNAFHGLTDKLGQFGAHLASASGGVSSFVAGLADMRIAMMGARAAFSKSFAATKDRFTLNTRGTADARSRYLSPIDNDIARTKRYIAHAERLGRNPSLSDKAISGIGDRYATLNRDLRLLNARRSGIETAINYGPINGVLSARNRGIRGADQLLGAMGNAGALQRLNMAGLKPGALRAMGNLAGAGVQAISAPFRALGSGAAAYLGHLVGPASVVGAAGLGAAIGSAPFLYAGSKVAEGRQKADEFSSMNSELSRLASSLQGSTADASALTKQIQQLGVEGAVPVEQLSRGASMLMLAFKGNQKETSKWTSILADMSAGTGQSVEYFAEMITKANQFGSVEFEVFNQLNEKGIPIIEQLKGKFGDTREEIMKAAQQGKITAAEFMKAFEAAHKASMEGANVAKQTATITGLRQQRTEYEELEAANYTRGYDAEMMNYERWRTRKAQERAEDESLAAQGELLGAAVGSLVEGFKRLGTHIEDFGRGIIGWYAKITGATDAQGGLNVAEMRLYNTGTMAMASGEKFWEDKDSPDRYYTAAELSDAITNVEANHVRLQRISNDDDFDDEVRNDARAGAAEAAELLTQLKTSYENAVAREAEAARVREGEEVRTAFNRANAHTESEILQANGYEALYELEDAIEEIYNRIQEGNGTRFDSAEYERLKKIEEEILRLRREASEEERKAAEEAKRAAEQREREAREAERRRLEEARAQRNREMYLLERQAKMTDDPETKFQLELEQTTDKLKALGFSAEEASQILTEDRQYDIAEREKSIAENNQKIDEINQEIEDNKKTGLSMETNAWGSTGNLYTNFTNPIDKQQLTELQKVNDNLQKEIDALNRLDIRAYAG